ncbi:MAG: hypothetical protein DMG57_03540 [Acidobacteria bacterium]|nr:MAG: hypothetical protein DMG57_03540 [Acidobacteriota bacterium]
MYGIPALSSSSWKGYPTFPFASWETPASFRAAIQTSGTRTDDIEQNLVRGVHGPGEIHVVLI